MMKFPRTRATLAIRPEKVNIATERPAEMTNIIHGKVLDIAYLGNMSTYVIETPTGQHIKRRLPTPAASPAGLLRGIKTCGYPSPIPQVWC